MSTPAGRQLHLGIVTDFDEPRGLGTVADDAGRTWAFHCTAIADGTRAVEVGTRVAFRVVAGQLGRMEATELTKLDGGSAHPGSSGSSVGSVPPVGTAN